MGTKSICMFAIAGMCTCEGDNCEGKISFTCDIEEDHDYKAFKSWFDQLGTSNVPLGAYTREGLAMAAFFAGMKYQSDNK